jgi:hypothetical protein
MQFAQPYLQGQKLNLFWIYLYNKVYNILQYKIPVFFHDILLFFNETSVEKINSFTTCVKIPLVKPPFPFQLYQWNNTNLKSTTQGHP